jgi:cytoskeletal protein CcmA (bactofilin family)
MLALIITTVVFNLIIIASVSYYFYDQGKFLEERIDTKHNIMKDMATDINHNDKLLKKHITGVAETAKDIDERLNIATDPRTLLIKNQIQSTGPIKVNHTNTGDWWDEAPLSVQASDGKHGASFGSQLWSHFPANDGNTYIRAGEEGKDIMIGDMGSPSTIHLGGEQGAKNIRLHAPTTVKGALSVDSQLTAKNARVNGNVVANGQLTAKSARVNGNIVAAGQLTAKSARVNGDVVIDKGSLRPGNMAHPDNTDGAIYRADGQLQVAVDDLIRFRNIGSKDTGIQFDTRRGAGDMRGPNGQMKITRQGIMFGGPNDSSKQSDSAQISAGRHVANSLNIMGMSSDKSGLTRKVDVWAEGGMTVRGPMRITGGIPSMKGGTSVHNPKNWGTHLPHPNGRNLIRGDTEIRGNTHNIGNLRVDGVIDARNSDFKLGNTVTLKGTDTGLQVCDAKGNSCKNVTLEQMATEGFKNKWYKSGRKWYTK